MKKSCQIINHQIEKAQVLPIVVIAMVVMVIFAALIVDGGSIMVNRREAQAAADAGVMAGARELCYPTGSDPIVIAENYAVMNGATSANVQIIDEIVMAEVTVSNDSFFSKFIGVDSLDAVAEAEAGCFSLHGNYLMPIGWSCRPSLGDEGPFDPGVDCLMMALDWEALLEPLVEGEVSSIEIPGNVGYYEMDGDSIVDAATHKLPPDQIYIVMDAEKEDEEIYCKEDLDPSDPGYDTALTCDLDGDGKSDIEGGGNRGWLDLDGGGGGASELRDWIENGLDAPISPHIWMAGSSGTKTSVYPSIQDYRVGDVVLIPVYNAICDDKTPLDNVACMSAAHASPRPAEPSSGDINLGDQAPKYHVITFNPFYISCVRVHKSDHCPGFDLALGLNLDPKNPKKSLIKDNTASLEGYFLTNVEFPLDLENHCDVNLGNCVVSLTK